MSLDWIGVDWGTTRVRAWAMREDGSVSASASSEAGMGTLATGDYERALLKLVGPWLEAHPATAPVPVLVCGMAGARQGWLEAPYATLPQRLPVIDGKVHPALDDPRITVSLLPGVAQYAPPDVMRGEETQIVGALALGCDPDAVLCLPGTHAKWVRLVAGKIAAFATTMTGELFAALGHHTVLRHSIDPGHWDQPSFVLSLSRTLATPESLSTALFAIRAAALLGTPPEGAASASLSGLLIGSELAATRHWWQAGPVVIVGEGDVAARYASALDIAGAPATLLDGGDAVRQGLAAARRRIVKTSS